MSLRTRLPVTALAIGAALPTVALALAAPLAAPLGGIASGSLVPVSAVAADPVISSGTDAADDVVLAADDGDLTTGQRTSIDLRTITITEDDHGRHRFTVEIARVARASAEWDQMVFVRMRDPGSGETTVLGFNQRSGGGGYAYNDTTDESCEITRVVRRVAQHTLSVRVPERCTAPAGSRVRVASATGLLNTDAPTWSRDRMSASDLD